MRTPTPFRTLLLGSLLGLCVSLVGCQTLFGGGGGERVFVDETEFRQWFAFYYLSPKPEELGAGLDYMDSHRYLEDFPDISSVFVSSIMKAHPERLKPWTDSWKTKSPRAWSVIVLSLWLVDTNAARQLARAGLDRVDAKNREHYRHMLEGNPREFDLMSLDIKEPRQINMLWAAFSATGDANYVDKVISYIHQYGSRSDPDAQVVGEAAIMTLATNALQHEKVARICNEANREHPNSRTRALLKAMLAALHDVSNDGNELPAH